MSAEPSNEKSVVLPSLPRGKRRKPSSEITVKGDCATVTLTRGFFATIDTADIPIVRSHRWSVLIHHQTGHAYAISYNGGDFILMHRLIMDAQSRTLVDHEDGDGLNNRRANLRLATPSQNQANRVAGRNNKIGVKGVWKQKGRFRASINPGGKRLHLGSFATKEEAAAAYQGAARVLYGDFACP